MLRQLIFFILFSTVLLQANNAFAVDRDLISTVYHADIADEPQKPKKKFSLDGELGAIVSSGNTDASSIKAALNSTHDTERFTNSYWAEFLYRRSETTVDDLSQRQTTAQRLFAYVQADYKLNAEKRRLFFYADYEDDRFNGYDYRSSVAAGWSQQLWKNDISGYRFSLGPGYSIARAELNNSGDSIDDSIDDFIVRGSAEYHYIWPTGAKFRQFASVEAGQSNVKSRSETSLSANLFDSLALKLSFILQHNTKPADSAVSLNTEASVAIVYRFF